MPELPEVETTRRGIEPHLRGRRISRVVVRQPCLRWPIPADLGTRLEGRRITAVGRRAKYLLLRVAGGAALLHLGMSGSLRLVESGAPAGPHDHVDLELEEGLSLRLRDPRRFGCLLWAGGDPLRHPLLAGLGPEPWDEVFGGTYLHARAAGRRTAVKNLIMDGRVVVGVGNIYASEALFQAGILPSRAAGRIGQERYQRLADAIRQVLEEAVEAGGTTLRDFTDGEGRPGYFQRQLAVYGREGGPCPACGSTIRQRRIGQRSSYWCPRCQR